MKTTLKSLLMVSLLFAATTASAQRAQDIEDWMSSLISKAIDNKVEVTKSLGQERDIQKEGTPLKWQCDIYQFILPKKQRPLLEEMIKAFEANGHDNPNCYGVNSMSESSKGDAYGNLRNLMIGEDPNRYVTIGKDYNNFLNINILDAADSTKTHRYAYALEWREAGNGKTDVRYIVTYAKIPSATTTITQSSWPYLNLGRSRIPKVGPLQAPKDARAWQLGSGSNKTQKGKPILIKGNAYVTWGDKNYPVQAIDSLIREAECRSQDTWLRLRNKFQTDNALVLWSDTLDHEYDPVTDVVVRLNTGQSVSADDLLCNDNILLIFSQLKQQYLAGQNTEFNAISIYTLCKKARECGFFTDLNSKAELEQLKDEVITLYNKTEDNTCDRYLKMALEELAKIQ